MQKGDIKQPHLSELLIKNSILGPNLHFFLLIIDTIVKFTFVMVFHSSGGFLVDEQNQQI